MNAKQQRQENDEDVEELASYLIGKQQGRLQREQRDTDMLAFNAVVETLPEVAKFLRDDRQCLFRLLIDICAVDYPQRTHRFEVVYHLLSTTHNTRLRLIVTADETTFVPSLHTVFPCAAWYERECWDMFGVRFRDHPDLRRLLCDYGFQGHPLRKDFPLSGYSEVRYDETQGRVVYEKVSMAQDLRDTDTLMPWHGLPQKMQRSASERASDDRDDRDDKD